MDKAFRVCEIPFLHLCYWESCFSLGVFFTVFSVKVSVSAEPPELGAQVCI